jgi:hypothetical protein
VTLIMKCRAERSAGAEPGWGRGQPIRVVNRVAGAVGRP